MTVPTQQYENQPHNQKIRYLLEIVTYCFLDVKNERMHLNSD